VQIYFAGDKLLTTPNPDVNEDMKMFEMLVWIHKTFHKSLSTTNRWSWRLSICPLGEKPKWSRPGHTIERRSIWQRKKNLESLYHTNHLFKTGGFFYEVKLINYLRTLTDHFEVLLPKLLDF
jgi:hypothetical protein